MVRGLSSKALIQDLEALTLPIPNPAGLIKSLYSDLYKTNPDHFDMGDPLKPDMDWLEGLGIDSIYAYKYNLGCRAMDPGIKGAFRVIDDPLMRKAIQSLAFGKVTNEDIELIVNGKFDIGYASEDFEAFLKYFFDIHDWNFNERQEYMQLEQKSGYKRFYKLALEGDKPYLMWKLGLSPSRTYDDMLREMFDDSFYNFKERSRHDPELAQKWGTLAVKLSDKIEKNERDDKEKDEYFQSFQIETDNFEDKEEPFPHISEFQDTEAVEDGTVRIEDLLSAEDQKGFNK